MQVRSLEIGHFFVFTIESATCIIQCRIIDFLARIILFVVAGNLSSYAIFVQGPSGGLQCFLTVYKYSTSDSDQSYFKAIFNVLHDV